MKTKQIFFALSLILSVGLLTQCEKYGNSGKVDLGDEESDRPEWAGGNTDENPHIEELNLPLTTVYNCKADH